MKGPLIKKVRIDELEDIPFKLRKMTKEEVELLKRSIAELGYVEPIQVVYYSDTGKYRVVNGQHRLNMLRDEFKVEEVDVVVVGQDWPEDKYIIEAFRLNNIKGDYDIEVAAELIKKLRKKYAYDLELRQKLGFTSKDTIFKQMLKTTLPQLDKEKKQKVEKLIASDSISSISEVVNLVKRENVLVFTLAGTRFIVVKLNAEQWEALQNYVDTVGKDVFHENVAEWVESLTTAEDAGEISEYVENLGENGE